MKKTAWVALLLVVVFLMGSATSCAKKDIVIGFCGPLTGGTSFLGQTGLKASQLAVDEANKAGGINGRKIKLVSYNDQGTPAEGLAAINRLIDQDKAVAIIGPFNSSVTLAILDTIDTKKTPILTTAGNTKITNSGKKYVFRTSLDNEMQGVALANYTVDTLGKKKLVLLYPNDDFGIELKDFFLKTAEAKEGVQILSTQGYNEGTTDFYGLLSGIKPLRPEAILLAGYIQDSSQIMRQAKELGIDAQFVGFGALADDSLQELAGDACEGLKMIALFEPANPFNDVGRNFVTKYKAAHNEDANSYSGEAYGSTLILLEGIRKAKTVDGTGIRDAIAASGVEVPLGKMTFDARGQGLVRVIFSEIKDGKRVLAEGPEPVTGPYLLPSGAGRL